MKLNGTTMSIIFLIITLIIIFRLLHYAQKSSVHTEPKIITIGTPAEILPFSFMRNNTVVGLDIDIINELAKRMGKKIVMRTGSFDNLVQQLQQGTIAILVGGLTEEYIKGKNVLITSTYVKKDRNNYVFALSKDFKDLFDRIQVLLHEMQEDGSLESLKRAWNVA